MKLSFFRSLHNNTLAENKLLKFAVVVISVVVLFNTYMLYLALNRQTTVLVPPGLNKKVVISDGKLDEEYVRTMARYVANLAFTYAPMDVRNRFDDLLLLFDAESYKDYYKTFYDLAGIVETKNVSSAFYITQPIYIDTKEKTIKIEGLNRQYKDNAKITEIMKKVIIQYKVDETDNSFRIVKFEEKGE